MTQTYDSVHGAYLVTSLPVVDDWFDYFVGRSGLYQPILNSNYVFCAYGQLDGKLLISVLKNRAGFDSDLLIRTVSEIFDIPVDAWEVIFTSFDNGYGWYPGSHPELILDEDYSMLFCMKYGITVSE